MKFTALHARTISLVLLGAALFVLFSTHPTFASASSYFDSGSIFSGIGLSTATPTQLALNLLAALLSLIGLIDVCVIIYGGFTILMSNGNPEKVKSGRDTVVWAIVGSLIIFSALGIVIYIGSIIAP
jgi:hypothetical protein